MRNPLRIALVCWGIVFVFGAATNCGPKSTSREKAQCPDLNVSDEELRQLSEGVEKAINESPALASWRDFGTRYKSQLQFATATTGIYEWNGSNWVQSEPCPQCMTTGDISQGFDFETRHVEYHFFDGSVLERGSRDTRAPDCCQSVDSETVTLADGLVFSAVQDRYSDLYEESESLGPWKYHKIEDSAALCEIVFEGPIGRWSPACPVQGERNSADGLTLTVAGHQLWFLQRYWPERTTSSVELHYDDELRFYGTLASGCTLKPISGIFPDIRSLF